MGEQVTQLDEKGNVPGEPPYGTGQVIIGVAHPSPTDRWQADWIDAAGHVVSGPQDATFDECMSWALNDAKPARVLIWTQFYGTVPGAGLPFDEFDADPTYRPPETS